MKIGTRITLTTVTLVLVTLGLYGWVTLRNRRIELTADLERQTAMVGTAVRISLVATLQHGLYEDQSRLVAHWQEAEPSIGLTYFDLERPRLGEPAPAFVVADRSTVLARFGKIPEGPEGAQAGDPERPYFYMPAEPDPTRASRLQRMAIQKLPVGEHILQGDKPIYALIEPITDKQDRVIAAIELKRDEADIARALNISIRNVVWAVAGLGLLLMWMVWLSTRQWISAPLNRLIEAINDVTKGDLGRVILRERDDEVGDLAERFNEMTGSLREAREEILANVDAKLALEARLRHSEKLATIGQLAAGIAHEVGTPLNVIGGRARQMEKKALGPAGESGERGEKLDPAEVAKNASIIAAQTQRITKIIQQLLDFARRPAASRTTVNLHGVAHDCLDFLEHQLANSRVEAKVLPFAIDTTRTEGSAVALLPPATPVVRGDADQLQQVCLNLCVNAIQAMPQGGTLELSTRALVRRRPGLDVAEPGRFVVLEVADTGVGIPEEDRERIFEPFYSTKSPSSDGKNVFATGLGLAVSVGIVKDHDGWMEIDSRPGPGTLFRVFLPAAELTAEHRAVSVAPDA
jgi:signal transduction histidine kinase